MFHTPQQEFFVADVKSQCPELLFRIHSPDMTRLIHGLCMRMVELYSPNMPEYIDPTQNEVFEDTSFLGHRANDISTELPFVYYTQKQEDIETQHSTHPPIQPGQVYSAYWPIETILAYVRSRNLLPDYLVGEEHFTKPLIYQALYVAHEWRVLDLKRKISKSGIHFGSATGWYKMSFIEDVETWPTRFNFQRRTCSPLPHEDAEFYAAEQKEWESKQNQESK